MDEYTVTFHFEDDNNSIEIQTVQDEDHHVQSVPEVPDRIGYEFQGWFVYPEPDSSSKIQFTFGYIIDSNLDVYAEWSAIIYDITFQDSLSEEIYYQRQRSFGETYGDIPDPQKSGYVFSGWNSRKDGSGAGISSDSIVDEYSASIYYAQWKQSDETTYHINHYQQHIEDDGYTLVETETWTGTTDTVVYAEGKTYTGFSEVPDHESQVASGTIAGDGTLVLKLYYDRDQYTVQYESNGGTAVRPATDVRYEARVPAPNEPTKAGYTFAGWYTETTLEHEWVFSSDQVMHDTRLYAKWRGKTYAVTLSDGIGHGGSGSITATFAADMPAALKPVCEGYTFTGYYDGTDENAVQYYASDMGSVQTWDKLTDTTLYARWSGNPYTSYIIEHYQQHIEDDGYTLAETETWTGTTDTVAYAEGKTYTGFSEVPDHEAQVASGTIAGDGTLVLKLYYDRDQYTVQYESNGGTAVSPATDVRYEARVPAPNEPTKAGYTFAGWYTETTLEHEWVFSSDQVVHDTRLYAKWRGKTYAVTLSDGIGHGGSGSVTATYAADMPAALKPVCEGYTFTGYYDGTDETAVQYYASDMGSVQTWDKLTDTILYARWSGNPYTSYTIEHYQQHIEDDGYTLAETESRTGTTDTVVYAEAKTYTGFSEVPDHEAQVASGTIAGDGSLVLKLYYDRDQYTVQYESNGGTAVSPATGVRYEAGVPAPNEPTKAGYTFAGWYKETTLEHEWVFSSDQVMHDTRLYAKWRGKTYAVTLSDGIGHGGSGSITATFAADMPAALKPVCEGYTFTGYYDGTDENAMQYYASDMGSVRTWDKLAGTTLYARWSGKTGTTYHIEHYQQHIEDDGYTLAETESRTGTTDTVVYAEAKTYTGFSEVPDHEAQVASGTIAGDGSLVLKLYYDRDQYTVQYESNGGTAVSPATGVRYEAEVPAPNEPTKAGYTFAGWYKESSFENQWSFISEKILSDTVIYAKWSAHTTTLYTVEHYQQHIEDDGYSLAESEFRTGTTDTLVYAEARTYAGFSEVYDHESRVASGTISGDGSLVLKLYYDRDLYTVQYESNGGTAVSPAIGVRYEAGVSAPNEPTKVGYTFEGWYEDSSAEHVWVFTSDIITGNRILFAKWSNNTYVIYFDPTGGVVDVEWKEVLFDQIYGELPTATRYGYNFSGWSLDGADGGSGINENSIVTVNKDHTLVADWQNNSIRIDYSDNLPSWSIIEKKWVYYLDPYGSFPEVTREGYTLIGWNTSQDGTGEWVDEDSIVDIGDIVTLDLYAQWEKDSYMVDFIDDSGSIIDNVEVEYLTQVGLDGFSAKMSWVGYAFTGWNTQPDGSGVSYTSNAIIPVTSNLTLYSQWRPLEVGDRGPAGGYIFYKDDTDQYDAWDYLEAAPGDAVYSEVGYFSITKPIETSRELGMGVYNTAHIISAAASVTLDNHITGYCANLDLNGFDDWFLPSITELGYIYSQLYVDHGILDYGYMIMNLYMSSTFGDTSGERVWVLDQTMPGGEGLYPLTNVYNVIPIRAFSVGESDYELTYDLHINQSYALEYMSQEALDIVYLPSEQEIHQDGLVFLSWNTQENGEGSAFDAGSAFVMPNEDVTLYGQWGPETVSVILDNGNGESESITATYGLEMPDSAVPIWEGYTFEGYFDGVGTESIQYYSPDMSSMRTWDKFVETTLYANWTANTETGYRVEHYQQHIEDDGYTLFTTDDLSGTTDTTATAAAKSYTGFSEDTDHYSRIPEGVIVGDGSLVLKLYYDRELYTVQFESNGGSSVNDRIGVKYASTITAPTAPTRAGYTFAGWYQESSLDTIWDFTTGQVVADTMLYANWTANTDSVYRVEHYQQHIGDDGYALADADNLSGTTDTTATAAAKSYTRFSENTDHEDRVGSGTVTSDGSLVLKLYYDRDLYTVQYDSNGGSAVGSTSVRYESFVDRPITPERYGYYFRGWYKEPSLTNVWYFSDSLMVPPDPVIEDTIIYAGWGASSYIVHLNDALGTGGSGSVTATFDAEMPAASKPVRSGYTFIGYYDGEGTGSAQYYDENMHGVRLWDSSTTTTLYAHWEPVQYYIYFNNGYDDSYDHEGLLVTYKESETFNPPIVERVGYEFNGWFTQPNGGGSYISSYNYSTYTDDFTVYANWSPEIYTVYFNRNGALADPTHLEGIVYFEEPYNYFMHDFSTLEEPHYTFIGWNTKQDGSGEYITADTLVSIAENHTLYAQIDPNSYPLNYDANGGILSGPDTKQVVYNTEFGPFPGVTRAGYQLLGWVDISTAAYVDEHTIYSYMVGGDPSITLQAQWQANPNTPYLVEHYQQHIEDDEYTLFMTDDLSGTTDTTATAEAKTFTGFSENTTIASRKESGNIAGDGTLVLKLYYDRDLHTVQYESNGGSSVNDTTEVKFEATITAPTAPPTRTGYSFSGWYQEASLEHIWDFTNDIVTSDITLYADWSIDSYTITYHLNGGFNDAANPSDYTIASSQILLGAPTRVGYTFAGWYSDAVYTTASSTIAAGSVGDRDFYAKWVSISYPITYHLNGGLNAETNPSDYTIESLQIVLEVPTRDGYTFAGWYSDADYSLASSSIPAGSTGARDFYANWTANTDTGYRVEHYQQHIEDDEYTLFTTDDLTGTTDTTATAAAKSYTGFSENTTIESRIESGNIAGDGSLVLKLYYDRDLYAVSYSSNGGSVISDTNGVKYESTIAEPAEPTRAGYTFAGWYQESTFETAWDFITEQVVSDTTLYAGWTANTNTPYRVEHYQQHIEDNEYTLAATDDLTGTTDTTATAAAKSYTGFSENTTIESRIESGNIAGDGSLVLKLYYDRDLYAVSYSSNGGSVISDTNGVKYESTIAEPAEPTRAGYTFAGWYQESTLETAWDFITEQVVSDTTLYAGWTANTNTPYRVEHYQQHIEDNEYTLAATDDLTGTTDTTATAAAKSYTGFSENTAIESRIASGNIAGDGSLVLKLYYDRDLYTVSYTSNGGSVISDTNGVKYRATIAEPAEPTRAGYTFAGWYQESTLETAWDFITEQVVSDTTLYAGWTANTNTPYRVEHYQQNVEDDNYILAETDEETGMTDTTAIAETNTYTGFSENTSSEFRVASGNIAGDGTLVLKLYYDRDQYTVSYNSNGGSLISDTNGVKYEATIDAPEAPTKVGYTFGGWYQESNLDTVWDFTTDVVTTDVTLYAKWAANTYTVTLNDGVGIGGSGSVDATYDAEMPTATKPERTGYTFTGYYDGTEASAIQYYAADMSSMLEWDKPYEATLFAKWTAASGTIYRVEHYQQHIEDNEYTLFTTDALTGTTDTTATAAAKSYTGFSENTAIESRIASGNIAGDGSLVLKLYYDRDLYTVSYTSNGGSLISDTNGVKYRATIAEPAEPTRAGYTFSGWYQESTLETAWDFITEQVVSDTTLYAGWTANTNTPYRVEHYQQHIEDNEYTLFTTDDLTGTTDTTATAESKSYTGFSENTAIESRVESGIIAGDGSLVLKLYYDRDQYTVSYTSNGGSLISDTNGVKYESTIAAPTAPSRAGYTFAGWYQESTLETAWDFAIGQVIADTTLYAGWTANTNTPYRVEHYQQHIEDNEYTLFTTDDLTGTTDTTATAAAKSYTGFSENITIESRVESGIIAGDESLVLMLYYDRDLYTVSYTSNGGSLISDTNGVKYRATIAAPAAPTRAGYTFAGWYQESTLETAWDFATDVVTTDVTLYAKWAVNTYTVTLNDGVGIGGSGSVDATYDAEMPTATKPERTGYTFTGYYDGTEASAIQYYAADMSSVRNWDKAVDTTLYANWAANTDTGYRVEHYQQNVEDDNYILAETDEETGMTDTTAIAETNTYTGFSENTSSEFRVASGNIAGDGTLVLKLYYDRDLYTVSYSSNGGSSISDTNGVKYEATIDAPEALTKVGYTFGGWYKETTCTNAWDFTTDVVTTDVTLYAKWTVNTYTVTLNDGVGIGGSGSVDATYDAEMPTATKPERTGYTFTGYYDGTEASAIQYYAADMSSVRNWDKAVDTTLYAKWTINNYTITYHLDNGINNVNNPSSYTIESETITLNDPAREGYTFDGWYSDAGLMTVASTTIESGSIGEKAFYAKWIANTYMVTLDDGIGDGGSGSVLATYDESMPSIQTPTCAANSFKGYYDGMEDTAVQYYSSDMQSARTWDKTQETTLYAHWYRKTVSFSKHTIDDNFDGARSVFATDLDDDGDIDILGAASNANTISWWENDGFENFTEHLISDSFDGAYDIEARDIDSDGDVDICGAAYFGNEIAWWENDGNENFSEHLIVDDFGNVGYVCAEDVDGDNDIDLLGVDTHYGNIDLWLNNGDESFTRKRIHDSGDFYGASSVETVDMDSDGDIDILGTIQDYHFIWWENDGDENFSENIIDSIDGANSIYATDIDNDRDMDLLGTTGEAGELVCWINNGDESFSKILIDSNFYGSRSIYAKDYDGDGDIDIIGAAEDAGDIAWWENIGSANFIKHTIDTDFPYASSVFAKDVDGDGDMDVLGAAFSADDICWWENHIVEDGDSPYSEWNYAITYHLNNGVNYDGNPTSYTIEDENIALSNPERIGYEFEDWFSDELFTTVSNTIPHGSTVDMDFYAKWVPNSYTVTLDDREGVGGSGSILVTYDSMMPSAMEPSCAGKTFLGYWSGLGDDATQYYSSDMVSLRAWNIPENTTLYAKWGEYPDFNKNPLLDGDAEASAVVTIDLDGDGDIDVLGANHWENDPYHYDSEIIWWENVGAENFIKHLISSDFRGASSIYAYDINRDGSIDVLGTATKANSISWWENDGSENFSEHIIDTSFVGARSASALDIDGDGDIDILGAAEIGDEIAWWENDGSEEFTKHYIDTFDGVRSVSSDDVDGDGDIDVVGAAYQADEIAWWENDGQESFIKHTIDNTYNGASDINVLDVDRDGDVDVVGAAEVGNEIAWWENDGQKSFIKHTIDNNYYGAMDIYAIDLDGDGDIDVVGGAYRASDIAWWENEGNEQFIKHSLDAHINLRGVYAADLDGDWDVDIFGASFYDQIYWWENNSLESDSNSNPDWHFTIKYYLNNGVNNAMNPYIYTSGSETIALLNPSRLGYTFEGWYTDELFSQESNTIPSGSTADRAFYAKWSVNTYVITYYLNGGDDAGANPVEYTIDTDLIVLNSPSKPGFTFAGWYSDELLTQESDTIPSGSTGNRTFYAKWN